MSGVQRHGFIRHRRQRLRDGEALQAEVVSRFEQRQMDLTALLEFRTSSLSAAGAASDRFIPLATTGQGPDQAGCKVPWRQTQSSSEIGWRPPLMAVLAMRERRWLLSSVNGVNSSMAKNWVEA
jgi:hypothetical protein